jgi:ankyrin repeat protein
MNTTSDSIYTNFVNALLALDDRDLTDKKDIKKQNQQASHILIMMSDKNFNLDKIYFDRSDRMVSELKNGMYLYPISILQYFMLLFGEDAESAYLRNLAYNAIIKLIESGKINDQLGEIWEKYDNFTPLMYACENSMSKIANMLIDTGKSNEGHVNDNGDTALIIASKKRAIEAKINPNSGVMMDVVVELYKSGKSNPEHKDNHFNTAYNYIENNDYFLHMNIDADIKYLPLRYGNFYKYGNRVKVTMNSTLGDIKNQFLEKMNVDPGAKEFLPKLGSTVQFIFEKKILKDGNPVLDKDRNPVFKKQIYQDDKLLVKEIQNPPYGIVLEAVIKPPSLYQRSKRIFLNPNISYFIKSLNEIKDIKQTTEQQREQILNIISDKNFDPSGKIYLDPSGQIVSEQKKAKYTVSLLRYVMTSKFANLVFKNEIISKIINIGKADEQQNKKENTKQRQIIEDQIGEIWTDDNNFTALIYACYHGMSDVALELIKTGQSKPERVDKYGNTALMYACYNNMSGVALELIATGQSNPERANKDGNTALMIACMNKMSEVALKLIETGNSNPDQVNNRGHNALRFAEVNRMVEVIEELKKKGVTNLSIDTELMIACKNKNSKVALELIKTGQSKLDQADDYGNTALMIACKNKMSEVAIKLIETGKSKPDHENNNDNTALIFACENKMTDVALELIATGQSNEGKANDDDNTALMVACYNKMTEVALKLIETGQSNEGQVYDDVTALMIACRNEMSLVAWKLIETGRSNEGHTHKTGATALMVACANKMTDVAIKLIETEQSNEGQAYDGVTALTIACINKMSEVAIKLIETGRSNEGYTNKVSGMTALMFACKNKMSEVAIKLIETGQSKEGQATESEENTALLIACDNEMTDVAKKLIETGRSKEGHANTNGDTALLIACNNKMTDVALKLIKTGNSNPYQENKRGATALVIAKFIGMTDVIAALEHPTPSSSSSGGKSKNHRKTKSGTKSNKRTTKRKVKGRKQV